MGDVVRIHARISSAARKSSAVTQLSVAERTAIASSFESQTLPLRNREMVVRSQEAPVALMREAIASSSSPSRVMNSDSCIKQNVHQMHNHVNPLCASLGMEADCYAVHLAHMARTQRKQKAASLSPAQTWTGKWRRTYLREWREKTGLSLEKASAEMGLKYSQLSRIERGDQEYRQEVLEVAERLYKTTIWALLYCPPGLPPEAVVEAFQRSVASTS